MAAVPPSSRILLATGLRFGKGVNTVWVREQIGFN